MADNYWHFDPDTDPFLIGTTISSFGGKQDTESGQDNGEYAFGGKSYDPATDTESREDYAALPHEWYDKNVVKPGDQFDVFSPSNPGIRVTVTARDKGPGSSTGRGLDVSPNVLQKLGVDTDQEVVMDFNNILAGKAPNAGPPPRLSGDEIRQKLDEQPPESMLAGDPTSASIQQALKDAKAPIAKNQDGSLDYGGGISVYQSGIVQIKAGNSLYQYRPGEPKPHIVNITPKQPRIYRDPESGTTFNLSDINDPQPIGLPGSPAAVDKTQIKEGDWESVPEDVRGVAKQIADYKYPKLSGFVLRSSYFKNMLDIVHRVDPSFNYQEYDSRQKTLNDFTSAGKSGQNITSFNTLVHHAGRAMDNSQKLEKAMGTGESPFVNMGKVGLSYLTGSARQELSQYRTDVNVVKSEAERAVTGGKPSVTGAADWEKIFDPKEPHSARMSALKETVSLTRDRLSEVQQAYVRTFGTKPKFSLLSPEAEKVLTKIGLADVVKEFGSNGGKKPYVDPEAIKPTDQPEQPPPPTEGTIRTDEATGRSAVFTNGKWTLLD